MENEGRNPTDSERAILRKFSGFGPVALSLFPNPTTGQYKDASWQQLGQELELLLSPAEYESAKRTTFNAFYTSPEVIQAMYQALDRLGVPADGLVLEPGCGSGNFLSYAPPEKRFIGVELDTLSGNIAKALHPRHDIRIENFRDTKLGQNQLDAVIGNVPFANIQLSHNNQRFSLHDYFFAKSVDALKPGGTLALVTSHFTLDKQNAALREYLSDRADFLGAIRLPSEAFQQEGTKVVTDIVFLRKREQGAEPNHADSQWIGVGSKSVDGTEVTANRYFLNHPEMVLGEWTLENQLYGTDGFSIKGTGGLDEQLRNAIARLPAYPPARTETVNPWTRPEKFVRPPPQRHINEGSFYVGDDSIIYQIEGGRSVPTTHGQTVLTTGGTMMGKRLGALIGLRDAARLVLQAQNEDWPESQRDATRQDLHRLYDNFIRLYGPINKTTFSETKDGTVIRRMPNVVKFREDPDAMLVLSLEEYDEATGSAQKSPIFHGDVVSRRTTVSSVQSAEEGLLASLDQRGCVDLEFISRLYGKPTTSVIAELGELIYQVPETLRWETADVYLSGNVRAKLASALAAGEAFTTNAQRLAEVQPPDVLPGDIDANLGSPWIPCSDIEAFANQLFGTENGIKVGHLKKDALWTIDASYSAERSVAATSDFGTERANGTQLYEQALNLRSPTIYDTIRTPDGDARVINEEQTLAAREKQKLIKERFRQWIFAEPDRADRLVRTYNDLYNNTRPRAFDGSHLDFPGMCQSIALRDHQKNAVWRAVSSGNTLFAHCVGAGKTFTMATAGMKLKQAGLVKKPMYVVPNHMLEQFAREFMQLYPNAKLLVANKDDMGKERRKFLTAKIASGQWDGIIVTHSSFERIGMSTEYQQRFIQEQIEEYNALLVEAAANNSANNKRNLIKTIEKQKASRENRLKELSAEEKKDDGLVFDELGIDHIFVDESHYFKNLETPSKMERVAGIQTGGSQRAFDLFMKARYLDELHPGHGVTFATGTPISNSMVEMYTIQRFLDPQGLRDRDIEHFDAWAATFGEVIESMEISPDGQSLRPRSRFAKFNNLPELQQMFRSFADVQTADMLNLPRPILATGKPITVACPMSPTQQRLQQSLVERYEKLRSSKVDPRVDNALAITTDGRKLALDGRMLSPEASDEPESKINALVDNVARIWNESTSFRGSQLIFSDMGVHPTACGFSVYDDIIRKLVDKGIPREQIATIGDADSDVRKQVLFDKVRNGSVRILLGSTQKMGTGTNVQKRLIALHNVDAPWKPSEVEQRDGRILRQGNLNPEVSIYRYVTQQSFDAFMWQALETKAKFISQIMTGNSGLRRADDIGGQELSYAEVKAIASGNPAVLTLAETDAEIQRLAVLRKNHADEQFIARRKVRDLPASITAMKHRLQQLDHDRQLLNLRRPEGYTPASMLAGTAIETLAKQLERLPEVTILPTKTHLGRYQGLQCGVELRGSNKEAYLEGQLRYVEPMSSSTPGPRAFLNALQRIATSIEVQVQRTTAEIALQEQQLIDYQQRLGRPFANEQYLNELTALRDQLKASLASTDHQGHQTCSELVAAIEALRDSHVATSEPERVETQLQLASSAAEPITAIVRRRMSDRPIDPDSKLVEIDEVAHSCSRTHQTQQLAAG